MTVFLPPMALTSTPNAMKMTPATNPTMVKQQIIPMRKSSAPRQPPATSARLPPPAAASTWRVNRFCATPKALRRIGGSGSRVCRP